MRQIADGLNGFLEADIPHFIEQQRENNGKRKREADTLHTHDDGVGHSLLERRQRKKILKVLEAHPLAGSDAPENFEILKRDDYTAHGHITENNVPDQNRQKQQIDFQMTAVDANALSDVDIALRFLHMITS